MINSTPQVVTIAGSDSGGGAGIQADLKTFQARQAFGMSIIVALTAQNTYGVQSSLPIASDFIDSQFNSLAEDFSIKAAKTGMLADTEHVLTVVENLKKVEFGPLIVDPVMVAKGASAIGIRCRSDYQRTTFTTSSGCNTKSARSRNIIRKKYYNRSRYD